MMTEGGKSTSTSGVTGFSTEGSDGKLRTDKGPKTSNNISNDLMQML